MRYLLPFLFLVVAQIYQPVPGIYESESEWGVWSPCTAWHPSPNPVEFPRMEPGETLVITVPPDMADTMIIYIPSNNYTITEADTVWVHGANVIILLDDIKVLRERTIYEELK